MTQRACKDCAFHAEVERGYECRYDPPRVSRHDTGWNVGQFPLVRADAWCGKFRALPPQSLAAQRDHGLGLAPLRPEGGVYEAPWTEPTPETVKRMQDTVGRE